MNYSLWQRFKVRLSGRCYLKYEMRPEWSGYLPLYLAKCSKHGYFEGHPQGYSNHLNCPICLEAAALSRKEAVGDLAKVER